MASFNPGPDDRYCETSQQTLLEIMRDYTGGDIPDDARAIRMEYSRAEKGKLRLTFVSRQLTEAESRDPLLLHFDLRRFSPTSGPAHAA